MSEEKVQVTETQVPENKEDIVARAAKIKLDDPSPVEPNPDGVAFNAKELEGIPEEYKDVVQRAYKSMQADYTRKTQHLAEQRKQLESTLKEQTSWSPAKIKAALDNPDFVRAATEYQNSLASASTEESYLSESDKKAIEDAKRQAREAVMMQQKLMLEKEHETLKNKYPAYDPAKVDEIRQNLITGKLQATSEHLFRVLDYEDAIKRAYKLGKEDRQLEVNDKINSSLMPGIDTRTTADKSYAQRRDGEHPHQTFQRILEHNFTDGGGK